jgi:hypothetical protein
MEYMARKLKEKYGKWGIGINKKTNYVCMGDGKEILKFDGREEIKPRRKVLIYVQKWIS